MDGRRAVNWHEASPGLSPAKHARKKSPATSSLANTVANPLEFRIPPTSAGWSWLSEQWLNPLEDIFFASIPPLDPG